MRAVSSPRFHPGQLLVPRDVLLFAAVLGLALLAPVVLLVAGAGVSQPAEGELLAPFRWVLTSTLA